MKLMARLRQSPLLAGVTLGVLLITPSMASAHGPEAARERDERLITSQGYGEVRVRSDSFRVSLGVTAQADTLEKARNEVNTRLQRVIQAINRLKIQGLVLETETLQITPIYEPPREDGQPPKIVGYRAENGISATLRGADVERLGDLAARVVDASVNAGANEVRGITFFVDNPSEARRRALQEAVNDAERNARAMAQAANVTLEGLHALEGAPEFFAGPAFRAAEAGGAPSTPILPGETVISGRVTAIFAFRR
jgi:uncharacterized protein YggE